MIIINYKQPRFAHTRRVIPRSDLADFTIIEKITRHCNLFN